MRRRTALVAALALLALGLTAQTSAAPPEQVELDDFAATFADVGDGLGLFVNIGRDDYCAWVEGGSVVGHWKLLRARMVGGPHRTPPESHLRRLPAESR